MLLNVACCPADTFSPLKSTSTSIALPSLGTDLRVVLSITSTVAAEDGDGLDFGLEFEFLAGERVGVGDGVLDDEGVGVVVGLGLYEGVADTLGETLGVGVILGLGVVLGVGETDGVGVTVKNNRPNPSRSSIGLMTSSPATSFAPLMKSFISSDSFSAVLRRCGESIEAKSILNP